MIYTSRLVRDKTLLYDKHGSTIEVNRLDNENDGESKHEKTNLLTASNSSK